MRTPAPWKFDRAYGPGLVCAGKKIVCQVFDDNDAQLIASAPEMLAMLRLMLLLADEEEQSAPSGPYRQLVELIARAEGV